MDIKVLGPGCRNCVNLEQRTREALTTLGTEADIEKITDPAAIASYGILSAPGLLVDGEVVVAGKVPSVRQLTALLRH